MIATPAAPPPPAQPPADALRSIVILADMHVPEHDRPMWSAVLAFLRDHPPDEIILAGDFGEFGSICSHAGGSVGALLTDDFAAVKRALNELREAAPCTRTTYLCGNHETRLERRIAELLPQLAEAVTIAGGLDLEERGIAWVAEHHQPIRRGPLLILHGHQFGGRFGSKYHSARAAELYADAPGSLVVYGHTHKAQSHSRAVVGGTVTAYGLGCGRTIGPDSVRWMRGAEGGWSHQFAVCYWSDRWAQVCPVSVVGGRFVWAGRVYGA